MDRLQGLSRGDSGEPNSLDHRDMVNTARRSRNPSGARPSRPQRQHRNRGAENFWPRRRCGAAVSGSAATEGARPVPGRSAGSGSRARKFRTASWRRAQKKTDDLAARAYRRLRGTQPCLAGEFGAGEWQVSNWGAGEACRCSGTHGPAARRILSVRRVAALNHLIACAAQVGGRRPRDFQANSDRPLPP